MENLSRYYGITELLRIDVGSDEPMPYSSTKEGKQNANADNEVAKFWIKFILSCYNT